MRDETEGKYRGGGRREDTCDHDLVQKVPEGNKNSLRVEATTKKKKKQKKMGAEVH